MSKLRFRVVETAFKKKAAAVEVPAERPSEYFAKYVFNKEKMFKYLPSKVYNKLIDSIDNGAPLDRSIADEVAAGMKKWALELGVTHYTHWFHPLTEGTAEKHDAFIEHDFLARFNVTGEYSNYCGLYGYTSFNAVRYFEDIPVKDSRESTNDAPDMHTEQPEATLRDFIEKLK